MQLIRQNLGSLAGSAWSCNYIPGLPMSVLIIILNSLSIFPSTHYMQLIRQNLGSFAGSAWVDMPGFPIMVELNHPAPCSTLSIFASLHYMHLPRQKCGTRNSLLFAFDWFGQAFMIRWEGDAQKLNCNAASSFLFSNFENSTYPLHFICFLFSLFENSPHALRQRRPQPKNNKSPTKKGVNQPVEPDKNIKKSVDAVLLKSPSTLD
jgi:hypothetical protein